MRIGYLSPDFRDHVVGRNLVPLFRQRDRRQFVVTCYSLVSHPDAMTRWFQQNSDGWRDIADLSDEQVADQIRRDGIDVLVDLTLHMAHNRLAVFARKPAPVQVTFAGYPGSTGLSAVDYRLSDPYLDPPGMDESVYSERTIRLPDTFWCYDPRPLESDEVPDIYPLPALTAGHLTFGCLNNFCKVNQRVMELWQKVLDTVPNSRLVLLAPAGSCRQRVTDQLRDRVTFIQQQPRKDYLEVYRRIDLGLDTFPYNGHTTTLDSLWMGVPVITRIGPTVVGRAGWSQLCNLNRRELAAETDEQFLRIAADLARDLPRLAELRASLRPRMLQSPLMDAGRFARAIEDAYRQMWRTWCGAGN